MENAPGKASQMLGKYLSMRGRTSTNVIESLYAPDKVVINTETTASPNNTDVVGTKSTSTMRESSYHVLPKISPATELKRDPKDEFMKNNPIVASQDVTVKPVHYRVHGKDATKYAMRALGNVDTLLNRYGFEDKKARKY